MDSIDSVRFRLRCVGIAVLVGLIDLALSLGFGTKTDISATTLARSVLSGLGAGLLILVVLQKPVRRYGEMQSALIRSLGESHRDPLIILNNNDQVVYQNRAAKRTFGYDDAELLGKSGELLFNQELDSHSEKTGESIVLATGRYLQGRRKSGEAFSLDMHICHFDVPNRRFIAWILQDLTERKKAEASLLRVNKAFESAGDAILIADTQGKVLNANPALVKLIGCTLAEMNEMGGPSSVFGSSVPDPVWDEALALGLEYAGEKTFLRRDGEAAWVAVRINPINDEITGQSLGWIAVLSDVTERRRAEQALAYADARWSMVLEATTEIGIIAADKNEGITIFNHGAETLLGYATAEMLSQPIGKIVSTEIFRERARKGASDDVICDFIGKDGRKVSVSLVVSAIRDDQGESSGYLAILRDQDRRNAQRALREKQQLLELIFETAEVGICLIDEDGYYVQVNRAHCRIYGFEPGDLIGQHFTKIIPPQDREAVARMHNEFLETGSLPVFEHQVLRHDGIRLDIIVTAGLLRNEDNRRFRVTTVTDITERKRAERELRENERLLELIFHSTQVGMCLIDEAIRFVRVNEAFCRLTGYSIDEMIGQSVSMIVPGDSGPRVRKMFKDYLYGLSDDYHEWKLLTRDGQILDISQTTGRLIRDDGRRFVISTVIDITERKRAELALRENERLLALIFDTIQVGIALTDEDNEFVRVNEAFTRIFGYFADELLGQSLAIILQPETRESALRSVAAFLVGESVIEGEWRCRHRDARPIDVHVTAGRMSRENGKRFCVTAFSDITERNRVARLQSRQAMIIEATSDLVGTTELDTDSILFLNRAGHRMLSLDGPDLLDSMKLCDIFPPDLSETLRSVITASALRDGVWNGEAELLARDGRTIPISLVMIAHQHDQSDVRYLSMIARDITDNKMLERELRTAKDAAESANRAKSAFLATMSHEIRTPMNAVIGMTGLLLDTPLNEEQRDFVATIRTSGDSLLTLINDILDFSKIESGKLDIESQPFDLRACVESVLELLAANAGMKGLDLAYLLDPNVPPLIVGDQTRLGQVLTNLVANAVKFTEVGEVFIAVHYEKSDDLAAAPSHPADPNPEDSENLQHHVSSNSFNESEKIRIKFEIQDTGIGIPEERMHRLFRSFSQIDDSINRKYGGSGLGLAISKRLVELMGGDIGVRSEVGQGSTFHFFITAEIAHASVHSDNLKLGTQPMLDGKRILIVDDNATNRRILEIQTASWGMIPQLYADPAEALACVQRGEPFDLAILDIQMPVMDGITLAREIRKVRSPAVLPLLALTSVGRMEELALDALFQTTLTKPVKHFALYYALETLLGNRPVKMREHAMDSLFDAKMAERMPLRILLAEDVLVNQKLMIAMLGRMGYRVEVVVNGAEVLQAVNRNPYDVIFMDIHMPEINGLEATRRIVNNPAITRRPRIVALTANAMSEDRAECLAAGMDDYLAKPIQVKELVESLERCHRYWKDQARAHVNPTGSD